ncbi:MAG: acetylxylan esterase [Prosthecobacter sp.]
MILRLALLSVFALALNLRSEDVRLKPLKDLNGYFPFDAPVSLADWTPRREQLRRHIQVATGLWPMPTKTPLNAVIHGKIDRGDYTIEKVFFESAPGFYVTGNLYRPKNIQGKVPGVMLAHGHRKDARLDIAPDDKLRQSIADGAERFESGGKSTYQAMCRQLARMGCVVWQWDMLGDSDSIQISRELAHGFAKQRPEMNTTENWGLYSPQAEAHCQHILALQTLNLVRGLDFLLSLPEVDPQRTAITGGSGGGTQTMLLAAMDDRIQLSFPVVMVSTSMQGGCTCENASLLRVHTGNVEIAAVFAPKPQGMNTADDWTKEMATKGFPDLKKLYGLYGRDKDLFLLRGEHFPHNYNAVTRSGFYTFLNQHFKLGQPTPVIETDFIPLPPEQLRVWDAQHPAPKAADPDSERGLLRWLTDDAEKQLRAAAGTREGLQNLLRPAFEAIIGRSYAEAGKVEWDLRDKQDGGDHLKMTGTLRNTTYGEEINVAWLYPKQWNGRVVLWLDDSGQAALKNEQVKKLVQSGVAVLGADLLFQGGTPVTQTRVVGNKREFAGYTHGYNSTLFAQRVHDVLTLVTFLRNTHVGSHPSPKDVTIAAWGGTGSIALAARALARDAIDRLAADTRGFRFGQLLDYRDPQFLPGAAKYLDTPGLIALNSPQPLWLTGEGAKPATFGAAFEELTPFEGDGASKEAAAVEWLLK